MTGPACGGVTIQGNFLGQSHNRKLQITANVYSAGQREYSSQARSSADSLSRAW